MKTLPFLLILMSFNLKAQALDERLLAEITKLEAKMTSKDYKSQAYDLLKLGARDNAFKLQAYGRLFENNFKKLSSIKDNFKILEDHIGQCKKWNDLLLSVPENDPKKKKYQQNLNTEIELLTSLLAKWDEKNKIEDTKSTIASIQIDESQTLRLADKNMSQQLKDLMKKKFDFKYGETGLHELRRSVRWPKIYIELFANKTLIEQTQCSPSKNNLYQIGLGKNKIKFTAAPDIEALRLNECAYLKLVGAVELLGIIKDELEKLEILEDKLPKNLREQSQSIYDELMKDVLPKL